MTVFDPAVPNKARVYSCLLGGKDHFPVDRSEADALLETYPPIAAMVRENRAFITRAVQWAAMQGIGQFTDLGAGLGTTRGSAARDLHAIQNEVERLAAELDDVLVVRNGTLNF